MKYWDAAAFRQALEQRLKVRAASDDARLARDRKRIVFERLLARLIATAPGRWLLKGGFALDLRLPERARATKDMDIEWRADENDLLDALIEAAEHDAGDFFDFSIERTDTPEDRLGGSYRFRVAASLGGRPFEAFPLDVGLRRDPATKAETLATPDLLAFAGVEPVTVPAIPLELQAAEKLHAYTPTYEDSRLSSRVKDLVDLALITELASLDAATLHGEIEATFARRATQPVPSALPQPPDNWRTPFHRLAEAVGVPSDLQAGYSDAKALIDPVLGGVVEQGTWDSEARRWIVPSGGGRSRDEASGD